MPSIANKVNCTDVNIKGNKIGKDRTGYNVPFAPAFEMIAAIIVDAKANPIFPSINETRKRAKFLMRGLLPVQ